MGNVTMQLSRRQVLGIAAGGVAGAVGFRYLTQQLPDVSRNVASAAGPDRAWPSPLGMQAGLAGHLLRRAGFGYTGAELDAAASMSYPDLVDMLLNQQPQPLPGMSDPTNHQQVVRAWYEHMATTTAQFPERMTLFWHGLLTSDYRKAARLPLVLQQNELYRSMGRSDFRSLINAVTFDPLMIRYLDLEESTAAAPNENYSRELMELFTLGVNNYTESDVREGARALSGIRTTLVGADGGRVTPPKLKGSTPAAYAAAIAQLIAQGVTFKGVLNTKQHDDGSKTFLGKTGNLGPSQILDIILAQPSCAPHIARLALRQFCTPNPSTQLIDSVATAFRKSNYDIKTLMRAIFTNAAFTSPDAYRSLVRGPADYMVATMRAIGRPDLAATCVSAGAGMNQVLYDMPNVAGWPANQGWVSSGGWLARLNFAASVVASGRGFSDPVDAVRAQLDNVVGPDTAAVFNASHSNQDRSYAVLSSPEFQLK
ncbi:MAG TPA: DUF1800 domain-containing protein [Candidatus Saccharimonadales bacterium]|nr:DUF1800 domain-containing protein [Candidatus Saccharimonadales bacterium]